MKHPNQPTDIARAAIKLLSERALAPTPENYRRTYSEVAGMPPDAPPWSQAIRALLREWDAHQIGLTQAHKREMLERVLLNFGSDPNQLWEKLSKLSQSWADSQHAGRTLDGPEEVPAPIAPVTPKQHHHHDAGLERVPDPDAESHLGRGIGQLADGLGERWPDLATRLRALAHRPDLLEAGAMDELAAVWREILVRGEDDLELLQGMRRLVALLFENISSLVGEDAWLRGQLAAMRALISGQLNYHTLFEAERGLNEIVAKQHRLNDNLQDAKGKLKHLISSFIDRIGEISSSTGTYQERLATYSERIAQADDIAQLADVVDSLNTDMADIQKVMRQSHEELMEARSYVVQGELRIVALEKELDQVSSLIREDQLTGALNRRGLEEAFLRETARAARMHAVLSVALLDIDHFKRLNDSLGHQAGDQALVHLAKVIRDLLRPTDTLCRYGGEEFLILLPNTDLPGASQVMRRLQRGLTKEFFMHEQQKVLITFSAGVVQWRPEETREQVVARADAAMYRAKAGGRNRVEQEA